MSFETISKSYTSRIEEGIDRLLPSAGERPTLLHEAIRYSMAAGGKRIRPVLLLAAAELGEAIADPMPAAVAVECLHTYSLIHDDLPAIDDSDMRRGRPSCHKQFDEATALLAGDALLTEAFKLIAESYADQPQLGLLLVRILGRAASSRELIGGQMEDILNENRAISAEELDFIHNNKTSALITACLEMGLQHCSPSKEELERIRHVGYCIGLSFQIVDDILDVTSSEQTLGKSTGRDAELQKTTYVSLHGMEASRQRVSELTASAIAALQHWGPRARFLEDLVAGLEHRLR